MPCFMVSDGIKSPMDDDSSYRLSREVSDEHQEPITPIKSGAYILMAVSCRGKRLMNNKRLWKLVVFGSHCVHVSHWRIALRAGRNQYEIWEATELLNHLQMFLCVWKNDTKTTIHSLAKRSHPWALWPCRWMPEDAEMPMEWNFRNSNL